MPVKFKGARFCRHRGTGFAFKDMSSTAVLLHSPPTVMRNLSAAIESHGFEPAVVVVVVEVVVVVVDMQSCNDETFL